MNERIKELAEQAGLYEEPNGDWKPFASEHVIGKDLERFAELVAAAEREACAEHYLGIMRDAVEQAVKREREACAKLCEQYQFDYATAIRGRTE